LVNKFEEGKFSSNTRIMNLTERRVRANLNFICSNLTRAGIIHILINSKDTGYCRSVKELSEMLGKYPSVVIHHLEKLEKYGIVEVIENYISKGKSKRKIWGLNLKMIHLIKEVYLYILKNHFTQKELENFCKKV